MTHARGTRVFYVANGHRPRAPRPRRLRRPRARDLRRGDRARRQAIADAVRLDLEQELRVAPAVYAASASASGVYSRPCASATAGYVIFPPCTLTPRASAGSSSTAASKPLFAIAST